MKNFLQVNRALKAKKNFNFNFKSLLVLSAVLLLGSVQVWGTEYSLFSGTTIDGTNFVTGGNVNTDGEAKITVDAVDITNYFKFTSTLAGTPYNNNNLGKVIIYNCKTTATRIDIVVYNRHKSNSYDLYVTNIEEGKAGELSYQEKNTISPQTKETYTYNYVNTTGRSIYISTSNYSYMCVLSVTATETGTPFPIAGEPGYKLNLNAGRLYTSGSSVLTWEGLEIYSSSSYACYYRASLANKSLNTDYVKFTTGSHPVILSITTGGTSKYSVNKVKAFNNDSSWTPAASTPHEFNLEASTTYYINPNGSDVKLTKLEFICVAPTGLAASSLTSSGATLTVTDAANNDKYEFYISESSTAPTAGSTATHSVTDSKTIVIDDSDESTTYYAWVRSCNKNSANGKSSWTALTGSTFTTEAAAPSCEAPSSVTISSPLGSTGWAYIKGETIQMHANVTGGSGTPHYTWQKKIDSEFEDIDGAPDDDDYEIANCTASNSGTYRCIVSTGDGCSTTSSEFDVKVYRVQILLSAATTDYDFTTIDRTEGYVQCDILLQENTDYAFKILEGHVGLGNNSATGLTVDDCTNWGMWSDNANHVGLKTNYTDNYRFTWKFASASNNNTVSVTYPTHNQTADKTIYFDNSKTKWSNIYYRIGNAGHNENSGMVSKNDVIKVAGTANFYQLATWAYNNFLAWHFADNTSWSGDNSIYKTDGTGYVIDNHTAWQKYIVSETITLSPTTNDGGTPKVWSVEKTTGMKTYTVTSSATNCTITLEKCTDYGSGTYSALSSGGTVMPTQYVKVTVTPSTGHEWNSFSVSGTEGTDYDVVTAAAAGTPGVYIIMGDVTFTASCSVSTYDITYHDGKGMDFSGSHATGHPTTHTYGTATDLKTATKSGYVFGGWYDNNSFTGDPVTSLGATTYTGDIDLYAKWEKDVYLNLNGKWSTDSRYFAVYYWHDGSDDNGWVAMTSADVCSAGVYKATIPSNYYDRIIFVHNTKSDLNTWDNKEHQSADLEFPGSKDQYTLSSADGGDGGKAEGSWASNYSAPTYTISFAANGGSGSMSNISSIACDAEQAITANAFTKTGYSFAGWKANVNVTIDDETVTAGSIIANNATIQNVRSNITLTAQWTQIMVSSITLDPTSKTLTIDETQTITPTVLPATALDKTVTWTTSDADVATVDGGVVTAVGVGSATITATANDGSEVYAECAITVEEAASCSGDPTALVSGTVYQAAAMLSNCAAAISGTGQQIYGLSSNGKFYIVGTTNDNDGSTGTVEIMNETNNDIGGDTDADFSSVAYLKMAGSQSHHSIKFVVPSAGTLTIWGYTKKGNYGDLQIKPQGGDAVTLITHSTDNNIKDAVSISVTAGTYYILSNGGGAAIYGLRFEQITVPNVSGLGVDDGATLSSIPLSWKIPGICDLSSPVTPLAQQTGTTSSMTYSSANDDVTVVGTMPQYQQFGVGFTIPATTGIEWISYDFKGSVGSGDHIWGGASDGTYAYWQFADPMSDTKIITSSWKNSGHDVVNRGYWNATGFVTNPLTQSCTQIAIYANTAISGGSGGTFYVRNVRYGISGQNDIDHIVLMRKEGSAATDTTDASATRLYSGTKSHYTDVSDVTGKNYFYTVFAVHASGAVSTGVSTSLTLYTITYEAGAYGTGIVPDGKKTHGIDFTLSSSKFTRDGFTQDGWSTSDGGDKIYELGATYSTDAALTLYPHWVAVSGPVITNGNPANGSIAVTSDGSTPILSAVTGSTVYIAATPNTGYNFTSWDVYKTDDASTKVSTAAATASTTFEMPSYAVTVNASFAAKTYTVTLNGNGGSGNTANVTATYGSSSFSSSITNPTKTGYIFDGWYSGEGGTGTLIINSSGVLQSGTSYSDGSGNWTNDGAVTLYAKWTRDVKTAGWGAPWGGTAIPNATTSTVNSVTLNACNSAKGTLWSQESYTMGNGDSVTINLASGYYISAVSTAALFDEYGGNTNKLYIQFNSQSTYTNSKYDLDDPITMGDDCYDSWETLGSATPVSVSPIPSGAQSAKIYCEGNSADGNYLYRIIVEITAYDCTPSTVSFDGGDATLGTAPLSREVCGEMTLPGSASLVYPGYLFSKWNDGENDYDIGDSYTVTGDVTFTAQWVVDNTSLRIPTNVVTLNNTNDARTTGSDDSTIDIDGDGNLDDGISLAGNKYVEWDVYITPGVYNVKSTLCVPSWGIEATVTLIDPAGVDDDVVLLSTGHSSGEQDVYKRYSETKKCDFTGLVANKRYIVRAEDLWAGGSSKPRVKDVVFYPFRSITKSATNGTITTQVSGDDVTTAAEGTTIDIAATPNTGYEFTSWTITNTSTSADVTTTLLGANSSTASTSFTMPAYAVTVTGTFSQIGYTIAHSDATNGSYTIKVGDASAVSTNTTGNYNQTVALVATPSSGYVFDHWTTSGTSVTLGNANIAETSFTMPAGNVTVAAVFKATPNVYYYKDASHYSAGTYTNPEGNAASGKDNVSFTDNPWTISQSVPGVTSVVVNDGTYDNKSNHINAYIKLQTGGDASDNNIVFTIAEGYEATISMKIGGYSADPTVTLKPYDGESLGSDITKTTGYATVSGVATTENNFNEIRWSDLEAGDYVLNVTTKTAYISEIDIQTEQVGYTVNFAVDGGSTGYGTVSPSSITEVTHGSTVSISENVLTLKETAVTATPTAESDEYTYAFDSWSVSDGASITSAQTITASFTRTAKEYTLTWDLNGGKVSTAGTAAAVDETEPSGSVAYNTALTAPVVTKSGYDFAGWTPSVADNMPAANTTYTATWAERFTVTYNAMTGSVDPTSATGSTANKVSLPEPTKDGYDFDGWYNTAGEKIGDAGDEYGPTAAITLYAKWKGECAGGSCEYKYWFRATTDAPSAVQEAGKAQDDFFTNTPNGSSGGSSWSKKWEIDDVEYSATYRAGNSTAICTFTVPSGYTATLYLFGQGSSSRALILKEAGDSETELSGSAALTADPFMITKSDLGAGTYTATASGNVGIAFIIVKLCGTCKTVTYHGNGATSGYVNDPEQYAAGSSVSAKYNSAISGFERTGYEFVEWNTAANGSGTAYKPFAQITSSIDDDIDLYAQWRIVIDANNTDFAGKDDPTQYRDVKVTNGATLTLTQNTAVRDIIVETGSTLNVNTTNGDGTGDGVTLATNSLSLVGGWGTVGNETKYDMPRVYIDPASKITKTVKTINFDIAVDNRNFYPIAVPFPVTVSDVDYVNATLAYYSNYGTSGQYVIKTYNGQARANADMSNCWRVMRDGTKHYVTSPGEASEIMVPGQGYILRALPASGYGDYAVIRFPMKNVDDEWTNEGEKGVIYSGTEDEDAKNAVSVVAYENESGDTKLSNKGWNILGVPYMTCFVSNELDASPSDAYIKGLLNITTGEYTEDGNVYVTVPKHDFSEYDQLNFSEAKLLPGWCFFVQMDKNATLTFDKDGERASAPFRATMYEQKPTVKTGIILSGAEASDKTTILVSDKYSAADYEINADLEKMFGENSYTLATYSLMGETRLAYNAMSNSDATNVIPIGYRAPADGEYTFAINPRYAENGAFEHVNLIDYETGFVTDLLLSSYSFATERTQNDERFALNVVKRQDVITVIGNGEEVNGERTNGVQKVIINDKLYIIVDGKMYSAEGALVK